MSGAITKNFYVLTMLAITQIRLVSIAEVIGLVKAVMALCVNSAALASTISTNPHAHLNA